MLVPSAIIALIAAVALIARLLQSFGVLGSDPAAPSPLAISGLLPLQCALIGLPVLLIGIVPGFMTLAAELTGELPAITRTVFEASHTLTSMGFGALVLQFVASVGVVEAAHRLLRATPKRLGLAVGLVSAAIAGTLTAWAVGGLYVFLFNLGNAIGE